MRKLPLAVLVAVATMLPRAAVAATETFVSSSAARVSGT